MKKNKKNKGLSDFIQKAMNTPDMIQRGKIHGSDSEILSNLTREEIIDVLNGARESGSVRLTGTREERVAQLRELRKKDLKK